MNPEPFFVLSWKRSEVDGFGVRSGVGARVYLSPGSTRDPSMPESRAYLASHEVNLQEVPEKNPY